MSTYADGDKWEKVQLEPGTKLYRLDVVATYKEDEYYEEGEDGHRAGDIKHKKGDLKYDEEGKPVYEYEGSYFVTEEQLKEGGYITDGKFDAEKFSADLQISPNDKIPDRNDYKNDEEYEDALNNYEAYKNHVSVFEVKDGEPLNAEKGLTEANYPYGSGGAEQVRIASKDEQKKLQPVNEEYEIDKDSRKAVDSKTAKDMIEHTKEVAAVEKGEVSQEKLSQMDKDASRRREEAKEPVNDRGINSYGLTEEELAEMEESEASAKEHYDSHYQENIEADKYDDYDSWNF